MSAEKSYKSLAQDAPKPSGEAERLKLFMDRLERIQADICDLVGAMDRAYLELTVSETQSTDFLTHTDKPANR